MLSCLRNTQTCDILRTHLHVNERDSAADLCAPVWSKESVYVLRSADGEEAKRLRSLTMELQF